MPALTGPVVDEAGVLGQETRASLERALVALREQTGTQLNVLTVLSLEGTTIEQASIQIVEAWKLGSAKEDKGVLLLIAPKDRKIRIEVGQGHEGNLTDVDSKRIIAEKITPLFKAGDFNSGIVVGVFEIARKTDPEFNMRSYLDRPEPRRVVRDRQPGGLPIGLIIFLVIIFIFSSLGRGRRGGGGFFGGGGGWGGGGFGGGFGGGGGGGSSWGGGGGGFSGGGASGDW